jgi:hypothetical protein
VLTDPLGRKVGHDPFSGFEFREGTGGYINSNPSMNPDSSVDEWEYWAYQPVNGRYELDLFATVPTRYELFIFLKASPDSSAGAQKSLDGLLEAGEVQRFHMQCATTMGVQMEVKKEVRVSTLWRPLENGCIGNQNLTLMLLALLDSAESASRRGDLQGASERMQEFIGELQSY